MTTWAEDLPYWKTGKSQPEVWIAKAATEIERAKGEVLFHALAKHPDSGKWFYLLRFEMDGDTYRMEWPVLKPLSSSETSSLAARRQAATMLYYDVKVACVRARVLGARTAFFAHMEVDGAKVASELGAHELASVMPRLLGPAAEDDVVEGEVEVVE